MSLAFDLFFFWESSTTGTTTDGGSGGGGKGKGRDKKRLDTYDRLDEDFWDVREAYLRSILNETLEEEPPLPDVSAEPDPTPSDQPPSPRRYLLLQRYVGERSAAITALRLASSTEQLKAAGARLIELNRAISTAKQAKYEAERPAREAARKARSAERKQKLQSLRQAGEILLRTLNSVYRPHD